VLIHYVSCPPASDNAKGTILLIHGFPQTWYQFRRVITPLSEAGYLVIVPDYRGAGESTKPWDGYTKDIMAQDLHTLITKHEGIKDKIHVVGHDIGGMIAHSYAVQFPEGTASVTWGECPLPGTKMYHESKNSLALWHFTFHAVPDLPELLIQGKEKQYIKHFNDRLTQNPAAISIHDLDVYALAYSGAGAMRAAFNVYRTFETDAVINKKALQANGLSQIPCLALWGGSSFADESAARGMCEEFYESGKVEFTSLAGAGHYIAEEKPVEFVKAVVDFVGRV
jgi:pimeloyl-ACP methyl ester carboxylesterase